MSGVPTARSSTIVLSNIKRLALSMNFESIELSGSEVLLEPLAERHTEGLKEAIADGKLWQLYVTWVPPLEAIPEFIDNALSMQQGGEGLAFAIIDKASGRVAGSTRFMKAVPEHKRVEIGFTFLGKSWQRSGINIEAKLLMLTYAFETLELNRVEFLTDYLNIRSRKAITELGAKQEGLLRNHMLMPDGRVRDSVVYSVIKTEWPGVKQHLNFRLKSYQA